MSIPIISMAAFTSLIIITPISFIRRNNIKLYYGFFATYLCFLLFVYLENKFDFYIYDLVLLLVIATIFGHFYIGENLKFYYRCNTKYYDRGLHFFGTAAFTLFAYLLILRTIHPTLNPSAVIFIFILSLGVFIGVVFELLEFCFDSIFKTNNQSGLIDTNFDLIFDILGAALAGIVVLYYTGRYF